MSKDGGPAFACAAIDGVEGAHIQDGMSQRDWYAGMALQGLIASGETAGEKKSEIAEHAWAYADAMLAARERGE